MREETLNDVTSNRVGEVVNDFVQDGAKEVEAVRNNGGTWDVTGRYEN